ncbi:MAG: ATP-binding protein [Lachnospiraceae bacterium]|nr:ATP-binding protein [Lachnospiraceae bacterium]
MEIKRDRYLKQIIKKRDNGRVKIITGIRRCGKSYLLFELYKKYLLDEGIEESQIIEVQLDEIDNIKYRNPFVLNDYIKGQIKDREKRYYVMIDEVQLCAEVPNPYVGNNDEKVTFIDAIMGLMKMKNADIYVTGSNSKMLSQEVLTQFRDRGDEIHLQPLSYAEFKACYPDQEHAWRDYCIFGGMPYVLQLETREEKSRYLKDLFDETYLKDIVERKDIRNDQEILEILLDYISSAIGSLTNPSKLENRFLSEKKIKVTHTTISKYLDYFKEAYIINSAKRYDVKGSAYFDTPLKYYYSDIGLRNARLNFRQIEEGHIMENIIYNELICRGYNVDVGVVGYSKNEKDDTGKVKSVRVQLEVDFVVNRGNQRYYIQSALNVDSQEKQDQETNSLKRIGDSFRKIVIVKDDIIPWHDEKGILYIGVQEFLLNENAIDS